MRIESNYSVAIQAIEPGGPWCSSAKSPECCNRCRIRWRNFFWSKISPLKEIAKHSLREKSSIWERNFPCPFPWKAFLPWHEGFEKKGALWLEGKIMTSRFVLFLSFWDFLWFLPQLLGGIFPELTLFPLSWPCSRTYEEHSWKVPEDNQDLHSQKREAPSLSLNVLSGAKHLWGYVLSVFYNYPLKQATRSKPLARGGFWTFWGDILPCMALALY